MYNLNYAPTTLGVQSQREIISGGTRTKKVEYTGLCDKPAVFGEPIKDTLYYTAICLDGLRKNRKYLLLSPVVFPRKEFA
jgi:hypothetical protein